ncbi:hypothetical protein, partial [Pseudopedobacter sp.]|uniref:hypothetical protein n=1 Tax=Pseudopedobacter sp. TaxID=1936787 RepID=UPI003342C28D
ICFCISMVKAQEKDKEWNGASTNWTYNLNETRGGTFVNSYTIQKIGGTDGFKDDQLTVGTTVTSTTTAPGWFPAPLSEGDPTTVQVRAASATQSGYSLIKEDENIKSFKIDATNALNKFIIRSIDATKATAIAKYSFNLKTHYNDENENIVTPGYARDYYLIFGHNDGLSTTNVLGSVFRDGNHSNTESYYTREAIFTGLRISYTPNQPVLAFRHRKVTKVATGTGTANNGTLAFDPINSVSLNANGTNTNWEVYCNNSTDSQHYVIDNNIYTVLPQTFHLFINSVKIGEYDIATTGIGTAISTGKALNAFMVYTTGTSTETAELGYGSIEISDFKVAYVSTTSSTLPVSLAAFTGTYNGDFVKLNWKTLSEKDNSHFEVLRSVDGNTFSEVTRVLGTGNSNDVMNYTATDFRPLSGVNYYKLKQVDNSGDYSMSEVIAVNTSLGDSTLKIVKKDGVSSIMYYSETSSIVDLCVTDINGRKLYNQKMQVLAGKNKLNLDISFLRSGVHVLSVKGGESIQSIKFVN